MSHILHIFSLKYKVNKTIARSDKPWTRTKCIFIDGLFAINAINTLQISNVVLWNRSASHQCLR